MADYKEIWNKNHQKYFNGNIQYDDWLDKYLEVITASRTDVIDLGCGTGNNSLYLTEKGKQVIACDYSDTAIEIVNEYLPNVKTFQFDMTKGFPFESNFTDLIIADLCLHYFSNADTRKILNEIRRVLTNNGHLIFRVNSVNDINHGAMQGIELEKHYFEVEDMKKRFFDRDDLLEFFNEWKIVDLLEDEMTRYTKPKILWRGLVKNK